MKKSLRAFLLSISCCASLFGAANKLSDIEPAREFYVDLEPKACDTKCLLTLLKKGQIFSFQDSIEPGNLEKEFKKE